MQFRICTSHIVITLFTTFLTQMDIYKEKRKKETKISEMLLVFIVKYFILRSHGKWISNIFVCNTVIIYTY